MNSSFIVKQYGRRLVLGFLEPVSEDIISSYYEMSAVEPDFLVSTFDMVHTSMVKSSEATNMNANHSTYIPKEWQFNSEYSM